MKAKIVTGQAPGGKRETLAEQIPMNTPMLIQFFPIYACNFKCNYCTFSADISKRNFISDTVKMELDLFKKCIDEIANFPNKVKVIRFVGMGEPLLHNQLADMIEYTISQGVTNRVEVLTNASLLTHDLSDKLISAGLTRLLISIQGTTSKKYKEVCGFNIDLNEFIDNLKYYYDNRKDGEIHIKIIDYALAGKEDEKTFYNLFGNICDTIGIEYAGPIFPNVDYDLVLKNHTDKITQYGCHRELVLICPQPYFTMQINPDGKVVPCYSVIYPTILGDCNKQTLNEIWNGKELNNFRLKMLDGTNNASESCATCNIIRHRFHPEDNLSNETNRLKKLYRSTP